MWKEGKHSTFNIQLPTSKDWRGAQLFGVRRGMVHSDRPGELDNLLLLR